MTKKSYNLAIVGGGRQGLAILEALVPLARQTSPSGIGGGGYESRSRGIVYAYSNGLFVTVNFADLFQL